QSGASFLPASNNSAILQFGSGNDALAAQQNGNNLQATIQAGHGNDAVTSQLGSKSGVGTNASLTLQAGRGNTASTSQLIANPFSTGLNGSLIAQLGKYNHANVTQSDTTGLQPMIGANLQATVQVGVGNQASTTQIASTSVTNTSVTAQFGSHNVATTV